ncbi:hypothetical protein DPMN_075850 [Dreissena polymorpha]|uniref:Uncharacterized protein n=1 Tax=Dreissena polymorpha TaxID=45954 RepID=A0A9D3YLA5_DREPO|nr:hypothetical protein DPMN_075850 [Dreissena polymorpha]
MAGKLSCRELDSKPRIISILNPATCVGIGNKILCTSIVLLPLDQVWQLSVTGRSVRMGMAVVSNWQECPHGVQLKQLSQESVSWLTDRCDIKEELLTKAKQEGLKGPKSLT